MIFSVKTIYIIYIIFKIFEFRFQWMLVMKQVEDLRNSVNSLLDVMRVRDLFKTYSYLR